MGSFGNFVGGMIIGAAIGAAVVVFTSPKSGDQTRSDLTSLWQSAVNVGKQTAQQREDELWAEFNSRVSSPAGIAPIV